MRWVMGSVLGVAAALAAAPAASGQGLVDDNPSASSRGSGQVTVFRRGPAGDLQYSDLRSGAFAPWASLGGPITSGPGSAGRDASTTDVLARGTDNAMYHQAFVAGTGWTGFSGLGGSMLSAPGVDVRQYDGYIDTYYRGVDNGVVARSWVPGSGWTAEDTTSLAAGKTLSAPALVSRAQSVLDVFIRGTDDGVYRNGYTPSVGWSGWIGIPGTTTTHAPAAATRATGTMELFVRGPDGEVQWASFDGAVWSAWRRLAGAVESGPAAVYDGAGKLYVFARQAGDVAFNVYADGTWSGWQPMHPPPPPPPAAPTCSPAGGKLTAHSRGVDYSKRPLISGRARRPDGAPLAGATVTVGAGKWTRTAAVETSGHYRIRIPAGPTRRLRLSALAPGAGALACVSMRVRTRAGVRLTASKRVRPRGLVRFRGRVLGKQIPRSGKLVELQAFDAGRWRVFAQPRSNRKGRYKTSYRLRNTFGPRTFRFRARVRKESGFPYEVGYSRSVRVRVR